MAAMPALDFLGAPWLALIAVLMTAVALPWSRAGLPKCHAHWQHWVWGFFSALLIYQPALPSQPPGLNVSVPVGKGFMERGEQEAPPRTGSRGRG